MRHELILRLALLILAAFLRFVPIGGGLPYISYVDEGHVLHPAIELLQARDFDSTRFTYPPLTSYLTIVAAKIYSPIYRLVHDRPLQADLPRSEEFHTALGDNYDLIAPPEIIILGRFVVACLSLGTVWLAGALARSLGGERAGWFAMLFSAIAPALVSRGSIAIIDTTAAFFALATIYFCERLRLVASSRNALRQAALAGAAAGFAFGGKYTVGLVFTAVVVTIATLPRPLRGKATLLAAAGAGLVAGIYVSVPAAILHPAKIIAELQSQASFYQTIRSDQGFVMAALSAAEIGPLFLIAGLAGVVAMGWRRNTRGAIWSWLTFAALLLVAVTWPIFHPFRNLLPLVPLLCISAALFLERVARYSDRALFRVATVAIALLLTFSLAWESVQYVRTRLTTTDSRVQAIDWLQRNAARDARILAVRELAILPAEWKRASANAVVVSLSDAADFLQQQRFEYVVTGDFDLRYLPDAAGWSGHSQRWTNLTAPMPAQATFGAVRTPVVPFLWRTNNERVLILKP